MKGKPGRKLLFPEVVDMKVGEYITLKGATRNTPGAKTAYEFGYNYGRRYSVKKCLEGLRIWRIK